MNVARFLITAATASCVTLGCSAASEPTSTSASELVTSDAQGADVQVLQVWTPGRLFPSAPPAWNAGVAGDVALASTEPGACATTRSSNDGNWEYREVDCGAASTPRSRST